MTSIINTDVVSQVLFAIATLKYKHGNTYQFRYRGTCSRLSHPRMFHHSDMDWIRIHRCWCCSSGPSSPGHNDSNSSRRCCYMFRCFGMGRTHIHQYLQYNSDLPSLEKTRNIAGYIERNIGLDKRNFNSAIRLQRLLLKHFRTSFHKHLKSTNYLGNQSFPLKVFSTQKTLILRWVFFLEPGPSAEVLHSHIAVRSSSVFLHVTSDQDRVPEKAYRGNRGIFQVAERLDLPGVQIQV